MTRRKIESKEVVAGGIAWTRYHLQGERERGSGGGGNRPLQGEGFKGSPLGNNKKSPLMELLGLLLGPYSELWCLVGGHFTRRPNPYVGIEMATLSSISLESAKAF